MVTCKSGEDFASLANKRITVQTATVVEDEHGGRSETWGDTLTVWAVIEPLAGREIFISSQIQSRVDARITVRYQSTLSNTQTAAKARVKFDTRYYNIKTVKNLSGDMKTEGTEFQQLLCTEGEAS